MFLITLWLTLTNSVMLITTVVAPRHNVVSIWLLWETSKSKTHSGKKNKKKNKKTHVIIFFLRMVVDIITITMHNNAILIILNLV